jgi:hypothetical protein
VNISAELTASCSVAELFAWVEDLGRYPQWMGLVHRAEPAEAYGDDLPVWNIELRARIGPFARSKGLVMTRTVCRTDDSNELAEVVFERKERDGRRHSTWKLSATVRAHEAGSRLDMQLFYGGGLWTGGLVERALHDEINASRTRLLSLVSETTTQ